MININEKILRIEQNCMEISQREAIKLERDINEEIENEISEKIEAYKIESQRNLERKIFKIEKEYNSKIFKLENDAKIQVLNKKKELKAKIKEEIISNLIEFTNNDKYFDFLQKNINQTLFKIQKDNNDYIKIGLTNKDLEKYKKILEEYNAEVYTIENNCIGGTICINLTKNILVDNTLKTLIEEYDF